MTSRRTRPRTRAAVLPGLLAVALGVAACGSDEPSGSETDSSDAGTDAEGSAAAGSSGGVDTIGFIYI
ncbi:hypothetical protein KBY19_36030, partial [Streptomyces sp. B15]|nr:hypothetical protein [Streptomyces sp. B15]